MMHQAAEIEFLATLPFPEDVCHKLERLALCYGKTRSVARLAPVEADETADRDLFLVNFEHPQDALAAAQAWGCQRFGFNSVIVWLGRAGGLR